jgi:hypothetical protein
MHIEVADDVVLVAVLVEPGVQLALKARPMALEALSSNFSGAHSTCATRSTGRVREFDAFDVAEAVTHPESP